jgi:predicted permease
LALDPVGVCMSFVQDLRYAMRQWGKSPAFTISAILTLALGIGLNLTIFVILYGVLLRPLPFPNPHELVRVNRFYSDGTTVPALSGTKILFTRRDARTLDSAAGYDYVPNHMNLVQGDEAIPLEALGVTSDFFHVFRMEPVMGHDFRPEDMAANAAGTAVLSDATWRRHFAADLNIVGRAIMLGNTQYTVIGVANPRFHLNAKVDVWVPLRVAEGPKDQSNSYNFVARLKPGVTMAQAEGDLKRVQLDLKTTYPDLWGKYESVRLIDFQESMVGELRPALQILMGAVGLLLLVVSANILSLLSTRLIARRREMGLRVALGASGWRLLWQLLLENFVLCVAGGCAGAFLADIAAPVLLRLSPIELPDFASLSLGTSGFVFAGGLAIACALVFSVLPAMEARRASVNDAIQFNTRQVSGGRNWAQRILVVGEVATSLVLLVGSALLLTSFWNLVHTSPGFDVRNTLTFKTGFSDEQAAKSATFSQLLDDLTARVEAIPGVEVAGAALSLPTQLTPELSFEVIGRPPEQELSRGSEKWIPTTAHFFAALRIPVISGRAFNDSDTPGAAPAVVISQQVANTFFKDQNPIGQHIRVSAVGPGTEDSVREIVGVVGDTKQNGLDEPAPGILYLPAGQIPDAMTRMDAHLLGISWVVRTKSERIDVAGAARQIFRDRARTPLLSVDTMEGVIRESIAQQRFNMLLLTTFGLIALLLGAAGLYGVMSYGVAQQTKEIGIRMAVGAQREDILRMVLREASLLTGAGLVVGIAGWIAGARLLRSLLFGVAAGNPVAVAAMCGVLLLTGLFAAWWPARRAAATEPMQALRTE